MALRDLSEVETVAGDFNEGLDHPEGVTWGPDGQLYAGGEAGQIYRVDPDSGTITQIAQHEGFLGGVVCDADANVYVCAAFGGSVVRAGADSTVVEVTRGTADRPMETPNYPCFHPSGDLYVSDSGEWDHDTGRIYRVRADGSTDLVSEAPRFFANGMCFDAAAEWLYVVESQMPGVSRLRVLPDGTLGERQVVATLPGDVPDGVQFDSEGTLYITLYTPKPHLPTRTVGTHPGAGGRPAPHEACPRPPTSSSAAPTAPTSSPPTSAAGTSTASACPSPASRSPIRRPSRSS